jgi:hypothetical protein
MDKGESFQLDSVKTEEPFYTSNIGINRIKPNTKPIMVKNTPMVAPPIYIPSLIEFNNLPPNNNINFMYPPNPGTIGKPQIYNFNVNSFINTSNLNILNINNYSNSNNNENLKMSSSVPGNQINRIISFSNTSTNAHSTTSSVKEEFHHLTKFYPRKYSANAINDSNSLKYVNNSLSRFPLIDFNNPEIVGKRSLTQKEILDKELLTGIAFRNDTHTINSSHIIPSQNALEKIKSNSHAHFKFNFTDNKINHITSHFNSGKTDSSQHNKCLNPTFPIEISHSENTEILSVHIKTITGLKIFSLCRFDDLFSKIKSFCEIHNIPNNNIETIVNKILLALDAVYKIYNSSLKKGDVEYLQSLKLLWRDEVKQQNIIESSWVAENGATSDIKIEELESSSLSYDERILTPHETDKKTENSAAIKNKFSKLNKSF